MTGPTAAEGATYTGLSVFLAVMIIQRGIELLLSWRNARRLRARGAREYGREHFPLFVALHVLLPLALIAEVLWAGARPDRAWPVWLALWLGAQGLRWSAIRALGDHWNVRIWVVPGAPLIACGPYRWLRHPNYLAVVVELFAGPLIFGAWRTALVLSLLDLLALAIRIPVEERALDQAITTWLRGRFGPARRGGIRAFHDRSGLPSERSRPRFRL
jgi:methyltransferase